MNINSDVSNYLKSVVPEWTPYTNVTENLLRRIVWNINKDWDKPTLAKNFKIRSFDLIH